MHSAVLPRTWGRCVCDKIFWKERRRLSLPHQGALRLLDSRYLTAVGLKKLKQVGKAAKEATVHELRAGTTDRSQRKGDLVCDDLLSSGKSTILDVGIMAKRH